MRVKKVLLTILLAIIAIMLLQIQVKAETSSTEGGEGNISEYIDSDYDYFLTVSNKILSKAELSDTANAEEKIIACIKGEYTGTISCINEDGSLIKISNFSAYALSMEKEKLALWIDGKNTIEHLKTLCKDFEGLEYDDVFVYGKSSGTLEGSWTGWVTAPDGIPVGIEGDCEFIYTYGIISTGSYLSSMNDTSAGFREIKISSSNNMSTDLWESLSLMYQCGVPNVRILVDGYCIVPASVFATLKSYENNSLEINGVRFCGKSITNTNASFTTGVEYSTEPAWGMADTKIEDTVYINFRHSGLVPGPIILTNFFYSASDNLKCYYYNETTKLYEEVEDAEYIGFGELQLNIDHCSKYVVSETELPEELVSKVTDNEINQGGEAEKEPEQTPTEDKQEQPKQEEPKQEEVKQEEIKKEEVKQEEPKKEETKKDETTAPGKIPYAGGTTVIILSTIIIAIVGTIAYIKNRELKGI